MGSTPTTVKELAEHYKPYLENIDFSKTHPLVFNTLQRYKLELQNAEQEKEKVELRDKIEEAVKETKGYILNILLNGNLQMNFKSDSSQMVKIFMYYEYRELYKEIQKAIEKIPVGNEVQEKPKISLKSLFKDPYQFEEVVKRLTADKVLKIEGNFFHLSANELEENKLKEKRAICALGYTLKTKHYFKQGTRDIDITDALSRFFNVTISKGVYNKAKDQCFNSGDHKAEDYFKLYFSI